MLHERFNIEIKILGEIKARENRSEGVCLSCAKEIMRRPNTI